MSVLAAAVYPFQLKLPDVAHNWKVHSFKAYIYALFFLLQYFHKTLSFLALKVYNFYAQLSDLLTMSLFFLRALKKNNNLLPLFT